MLFSTGLSDRDEGHDDIRGKHSAEQPKSYMKGHPSSPLLSRWRAYTFNSEGAFLVPLAPGQVSSNAIKGAGCSVLWPVMQPLVRALTFLYCREQVADAPKKIRVLSKVLF
jgi:hypothetical protein